jgi:hypothetical protein
MDDFNVIAHFTDIQIIAISSTISAINRLTINLFFVIITPVA